MPLPRSQSSHHGTVRKLEPGHLAAPPIHSLPACAPGPPAAAAPAERRRTSRRRGCFCVPLRSAKLRFARALCRRALPERFAWAPMNPWSSEPAAQARVSRQSEPATQVVAPPRQPGSLLNPNPPRKWWPAAPAAAKVRLVQAGARIRSRTPPSGIPSRSPSHRSRATSPLRLVSGTVPTMTRKPWTREQLVMTLALYCQLPFGKMHSRNPAVIALARRFERTPSAVALKLVNFASLDPDLRGRGVGGMGNTSAADRAVWAEFFGRWDVLAENSLGEERLEAVEVPRRGRTIPRGAPPGVTEILRETTQRRGQSFFRAAVMAAHDGKCCITGITSEALLRASHIVPWSHNLSLRLDPRNGLCLNALHDAAFDRGLITLAENFELCVSKRLEHEVPATIYGTMFKSLDGLPIALPERFRPTREMLAYHRKHVFRR